MDLHAFQGGEVKALGDGRVAGYLVRFSTPSDTDLVGDFFTKETRFGTNMAPPVLYHHGLDGTIKSAFIGESTLKLDDVGLWIEAQLDLANRYVRMLHDRMIAIGKTGWSSGAGTMEREMVGNTGHLKTWLIAEASITPTPTEPKNIVVAVKSLPPSEFSFQAADDTGSAEEPTEPEPKPQSVKAMPDQNPAPEKPEANVNDAVKTALAEYFASQRLADTPPAEKSVPAIVVDASHWKYDNFSTQDLALTHQVVSASRHLPNARAATDGFIKALALRMDSEEVMKSAVLRPAAGAFKAFCGAAGIKADEIHQSTLASYGDEWIGVAYSSDLWEQIRHETFVVSKIPSFEFPAGVESMVIPLESTDPTWYKVAQAASLSSNPGGIPTNTVTSSQLTTANVSITLAKMGARSLWTGELSEDAVLPFADQLRRQLVTSGAEYLEAAVIDGDTATGATTNINDIAGTPASTDWFLTVNGLRKSPLVTTTANSRSGGALAINDFLETVKLMGSAGKNALDRSKVFFIIDPSTHWTAIELPEVKTRDVFSGATIEGGMLTRLYGYQVFVSAHMCKASGTGLSNSAGKVDVDVTTNNTLGQILSVRPDQWRFAWRRRMTMETTRIPAADSTEIVALMRFGLQQRDTEGSAISYNLTV